MALYTQKQLNYERSIGLQMTNAENQECIKLCNENLQGRYSDFLKGPRREEWSEETHEKWLKNTLWSTWVIEEERKKFKGFVYIDDFGRISY